MKQHCQKTDRLYQIIPAADMLIFMRQDMLFFFLLHPGGQINHRPQKAQQKGGIDLRAFVNMGLSLSRRIQDNSLRYLLFQPKERAERERKKNKHSCKP